MEETEERRFDTAEEYIAWENERLARKKHEDQWCDVMNLIGGDGTVHRLCSNYTAWNGMPVDFIIDGKRYGAVFAEVVPFHDDFLDRKDYRLQIRLEPKTEFKKK